MPADFWNYEPRRPRHPASPDTTIVLVRAAGSTDFKWEAARLGDIARNGVRLVNGPALEVGAAVELRFVLEQEQLSDPITARVRWQRREVQSELACEFDRPLEWELMGELILSGAVTAEWTAEPTSSG